MASAAEHRAEGYANAAHQYADDVADAAKTRDQALADTQFTHDGAVAQAKADAFANWAASVNGSQTASAFDRAWANYQSQLAVNENNYQQAVVALAQTQAYAKADDARTESRSVADAMQQQAVTVAQAEQTRTGQITAGIQQLETSIESAGANRDGRSSGAVASLADAWYKYQDAQLTANHDNSVQTAKINAQYEILDQTAADAYSALNQATWAVIAASRSDNWQAIQNAYVAFQQATVFDALHSRLDAESANQTQDAALIDAENTYRHDTNAAFASALAAVSGVYSTYEVSLARGQDTYNASVARAGRDEAVSQAQAEAGQFYSDAVADSQFTAGQSQSARWGILLERRPRCGRCHNQKSL